MADRTLKEDTRSIPEEKWEEWKNWECGIESFLEPFWKLV